MHDNPSTLLTVFADTVWDHYQTLGRHDLPWRVPALNGKFDPYKIMVSELMLQQTQVARVIPKYEQFLETFPSLEALAKAPLGTVLQAWDGLGYNRRAKFLHEAAQQITKEHHGKLPTQMQPLLELPGIGSNTAGAILAFAYNQPVVFVETNIRTVFIHHFFHDQTAVTDKTILELVAQTLDTEHSREWYWALMDYGAYLKQTIGNLNKQSKNYVRQSRFEGSRRQLRGQLIRLLNDGPHSMAELQRQLSDPRLESVVEELFSEQLIRRQANKYQL